MATTDAQDRPDPASAPVAAEDDGRIGYVVGISGARVAGILSPRALVGGAAAPISWHGSVQTSIAQSFGAAVVPEVQVGNLVKIETSRSLVFGVVTGLAIEQPSSPPSAADRRRIEIDLFGEAIFPEGEPEAFEFQRGVSCLPGLDRPIYAASAADLARIYARPQASNLRIGSLHLDPSLPAYLLTDELLGGHFGILGTTGSGKSCSVALILRTLLSAHPNGHVLLIDPHNEYRAAFDGMAETVSTESLQLPYWLLNFEEIAAVLASRNGATAASEASILAEAVLAAKQKFLGDESGIEQVTVDTPLPYRLSDLIQHLDRAMGQLNKPDTSGPYLRIKTRIEALRSDKRFGFMFSGLQVRDNMAGIVSRLFRIPVAGKPVTIVDLSGVPSEIVDVVVSVLVRMLFDFAVWSERNSALPLLLVCEEAHRYISRDRDLGFGPTRRAVERIAKEGRKYGVSLCLVTQRPSEISESVLSQCNTLFALRMTNERDQAFVRGALPDTAVGFLGTLPALRVQEAIIVGEGVPVPVHVRLDDLPPENRPRSQSVPFSAAWQADSGDLALVESTITRWRQQQR